MGDTIDLTASRRETDSVHGEKAAAHEKGAGPDLPIGSRAAASFGLTHPAAAGRRIARAKFVVAEGNCSPLLSLRAQRSNPALRAMTKLDCFAPLAMTARKALLPYLKL